MSSRSNTFLSKYLSDPTEDVRIATENLLADFLHEIRDVSLVQKRLDEHGKFRRETESPEAMRRSDYDREKFPEIALSPNERAAFIPESEADSVHDGTSTHREEVESEKDYREGGGTLFLSWH